MIRRLGMVAIITLCAACGGQDPSPAPTLLKPSPSPIPTATGVPKELTVCLSEEPDSLFLYGTESPAARHIWQAIYDGPVDGRDYRPQPVILAHLPALGEEAVVQRIAVAQGDRVLSANGSVMEVAPGVVVRNQEENQVTYRDEPITMRRMVVTYTLRSDVRWDDGTPLTAQDSVYGFQVAKSLSTAPNQAIIERTASYGAVGDHQVVWASVPGFLDPNFASNFWHPLPRHAWGDIAASDLLIEEASTRSPMGWGPFSIRDWVAGEFVQMVPNPFYFRASDGLPILDGLRFRFAGSPEALRRQVLGGSCDVVTHEAVAALDLEEVRRSPTLAILTTEDSSWELLAFGITPALEYGRPDYFEDVRVRRGIAQCIDRARVVDEVLGESGRVLHSFLPPEHPAYAADELIRWSYDPRAGQALLAEAGWYDDTGDGIREAHGIPGLADGTPFQIGYGTTVKDQRQASAALIRDQLAVCGIDVAVQPQPVEVLFASGPGGELFGRWFDLAQFSWEIPAQPLCDLFVSSQVPGAGGWDRPNVAGFINDAYDRACRSALTALPGSADYLSRQAAPQRIFTEQLPVLPLYQPLRRTVARTAVIGLSPNPSEPSELWNIEQVDLRR